MYSKFRVQPYTFAMIRIMHIHRSTCCVACDNVTLKLSSPDSGCLNIYCSTSDGSGKMLEKGQLC